MPEANPKTVVLFGYYKYGNFGDDLMAVIFALALRNAGYRVKIFALSPIVASEFGLETFDDLESEVRGAHAVVYGGGGAFIGDKEATTHHDDFEADLLKLCENIQRYDIPLFMFSVGGDNSPIEEISPGRLQLLRLSRFVTFRNPEEVKLMALAKASEVFPDIVWSTALHLRAERQKTAGITIGIDKSLSHSFLPKTLRKLLRTLHRLSPHRVGYREFQQRQLTPPNKEFGSYNTIGQFLADVIVMDAIVTGRLHLGMAAMSFGIPAVQVDPRPKARLLFKRLGLDHLMLESIGDVCRFAYRTAFRPAWFEAALNTKACETLKQQCLGHIERMLKCLEDPRNRAVFADKQQR